MPIAFRVDASARMGTGHLQRCLALAAAVRALGDTAIFVTRDLGLDSAGRVQAAGHAVRLLTAPGTDATASTDDMPRHASWAGVDAARDATETAQALADLSPDWVVVDHYAFDARWHRTVAQALGVRIAAIDDLADRELAVDLLIDHNLHPDHRAKYGTHLPAGTPLLGGPRFALLGPAYADAPRCAVHDTVRSIGIFLGGTDPTNLSPVVLRACREALAFTGDIEIASTRANPRHAELVTLAVQWPRTTVTLDQPDLAGFFSRHDLQVGAGGGAMWERCCLGAPTLALVTADNQRTVVEQLARIGAVATLEPDTQSKGGGSDPATAAPGAPMATSPSPARTPSPSHIASALRPLLADAPRRRALSAVTRALVDGHGAARVALRLLAERLRVRTAMAADCGRTHAWRNDPATRRVSQQQGPIAFEDHARWFARTLSDPLRHLLIGQVGPRPVGVVRLDRQGAPDSPVAEVSIYLDPVLHGLALGPALLHAAESHGARLPSPVTHWIANVRPDNTASERLFTQAGYVRGNDNTWHKHTLVPPSLNTLTERSRA
jgi:UDP-2,4-diacetamido-2,4,6-trideoxy-beta-L-altropyranose hydrolase